MFKPMIRRASLAGAACLLIAAAMPLAQAGQYYYSGYGASNSNDVSDIVTDKFTHDFPHTKYEILVISQSGRFANGQPYCAASAGVSLRGLGDQMPVANFNAVQTGNEPLDHTLWSIEKRSFEMHCVRSAVANMMRALAHGQKIYIPHKTIVRAVTR